jgi:NADPH:quinone reductase-like Zn-dependent oxidoreductase
MRSVWLTKHGGPEALEVRETPDPEPKPGEVRIAVRAAGLNFAEVMARQGLYPDAPKPPCVLGYEGAGVVDAIGAGVHGFTLGERVMFMSHFGGQASHVCVPATHAGPIPEQMSFEEAAAIPVNYATAYHMLFEVWRLRPGDRVLVHMAAGGVGTAVLQCCRQVDNVTTFGTASLGKHDFVRAQGCTHPIDYKTRDYAEEITRLTDGEGVDLVLDPLGGEDWMKGYDLLRPAGMVIAYGIANLTRGGRIKALKLVREVLKNPPINPIKLLDDNKGFAGVNIGHLWDHASLIRREILAVLELYRRGIVMPHVGKTFPFSRIAEAHAELEEGRNLGKVLLIPD